MFSKVGGPLFIIFPLSKSDPVQGDGNLQGRGRMANSDPPIVFIPSDTQLISVLSASRMLTGACRVSCPSPASPWTTIGKHVARDTCIARKASVIVRTRRAAATTRLCGAVWKHAFSSETIRPDRHSITITITVMTRRRSAGKPDWVIPAAGERPNQKSFSFRTRTG